jgi:hypothetical protein
VCDRTVTNETSDDMTSDSDAAATDFLSLASVSKSSLVTTLRHVEDSGKSITRFVKIDSGNSISIYFQNVNRLRSKTVDLYEAVLKANYDVIILLETSLTSNFFDEEIFDSRYCVFRRDRNVLSSHKKSGGGVLIAVRRIFDVEELETASGDRLEHVCVRLQCSGGRFFISAVYLAPDVGEAAYDLFVRDIELIVGKSQLTDRILILGDFNLPKIVWMDFEDFGLSPLGVSTDLEANLIDGLTNCDLKQLNSIPNQFDVFLDLIFSNASSDVLIETSTSPLLKEDRHHKAYEITIEMSALRFEPCPDETERYKFACADFDSICEELNTIQWSGLFSCKSVDQCVNLFYDLVWRCFDRHVPKLRSNLNVAAPWDSKCLHSLKNKANSAAKKMKQSERHCLLNSSVNECECENLKAAFATARSEYQTAFNNAYDNYRIGIEESIKNDPKIFFKYVNLKKNRVGFPSVMNLDDKTASTNEDKCELFADFLRRSYTDDTWIASDSGPAVVSNTPPPGSIQFTVGEVEEALLDLDVNKGPGPDRIPPSILKKCASSFSLPLCLIFNRSLATCVFPEKWKLSFVTPIFKNGKRNDVSNYRGIAILSAVAKLFELLICRTLYDDLRCFLSDNQHGFMKGRSTVSNLIEYSSFILKSMESGLQVDSVYTDFSKAFDKVRHCLLLHKLSSSPIDPARCELLRSYLSGRIQHIRIGSCISSEIKVTSGVPQGSHLGPLCFVWFVNEITLIFKYVRVLFYADDLKLFLPIGSSHDCLKIQSDLNRLARWCDENALPLNVNKCKVITFTRSISPVLFAYTIGPSTLGRVDSIADLGVIFDSKMTFRSHIDATIAKGSAMLGFIKRLSTEFRDPYTLKALYVSLVRSRLEYACCVWQPFYAVHIDRIERIQEKFVKYALRRLGWDPSSVLPPYRGRCSLINLETLDVRRRIARVMYVFDILSGRVSSPHLLAEVGLRAPTYPTRRREFLHIDYHRTNYGAFEPINAALQSFNDVADLFDFNVSRSRFVSQIKSGSRTN